MNHKKSLIQKNARKRKQRTDRNKKGKNKGRLSHIKGTCPINTLIIRAEIVRLDF